MKTVRDLAEAQATPGAVLIEATNPPKVYFPGDPLPAHCVAPPTNLERQRILAELAANDLKVIRALAEGDTARITAHRAAQAALRAKLAGGE